MFSRLFKKKPVQPIKTQVAIAKPLGKTAPPTYEQAMVANDVPQSYSHALTPKVIIVQEPVLVMNPPPAYAPATASKGLQLDAITLSVVDSSIPAESIKPVIFPPTQAQTFEVKAEQIASSVQNNQKPKTLILTNTVDTIQPSGDKEPNSSSASIDTSLKVNDKKDGDANLSSVIDNEGALLQLAGPREFVNPLHYPLAWPETNYVVNQIGAYLEYEAKKSGVSKLTPPFSSYDSISIPVMSITEYLKRFHSYTDVVSNAEFFCMLSLMKQTGIVFTPFNIHRLALACLFVAAKFCSESNSLSGFANLGGIGLPEMKRLENGLMRLFNWNLCPVLAPSQLQKYIKLLLIDGLDTLADFKTVLADKQIEIKPASLNFQEDFNHFCRLFPEEKFTPGRTDYDPKQDPKLEHKLHRNRLVQIMEAENLKKSTRVQMRPWTPDKSFTP